MCICEYMPHMCSYLQRPEEDAESAGTGVTTGHCELPDTETKFWKSNSDPKEDTCS